MALFRKKRAAGGASASTEQWPPHSPPDDAPEVLKRVWPLVLRWGEGDDLERGMLVDEASDIDLQSLVEVVEPLLKTIDAYLDVTRNAERAVPFGDLAQAAIEARFELARRI